MKDTLENPIQIQYLKNRLHLKNEQIDNRIEAIKNNADVEYYDKVQKNLPSVIDSAVTYAMGDPTKDEIHYEEVVEDSLRATKRLMVFYRLREDKKVVEILIRSKVHERVQEWKNKEKKNKEKKNKENT